MKNYSIETRFRSLEDFRYGVPKIEILSKYGITDERDEETGESIA